MALELTSPWRRIRRNARPIERPAMGPVISIPEVGGLHHRYVRRAA
jgi:hypothetical protein